jgi:uncharacterized protein DUF1707
MTRPGDEPVPGGGHLRASHTDREQAVVTLKAAFVQGRLAKDELDERVGQALAARTYAELAAVISDIPAGLNVAQAPPQLARKAAQRPENPNVAAGGRASAVATTGTVLLWVVFVLTSNTVMLITAAGATATAFVASFLTVTQMLGAWLDDHRRGQLPPPPAPDAIAAASRPAPAARSHPHPPQPPRSRPAPAWRLRTSP